MVEVGESGLLSLTLAPEYYVHNGVVDWDALGHGATMEVPFTVDVEDPQILEVKVDTEHNVMLVTASDDQYLAGVLLYDVTGRKLLKSVGTTPDAKPGETITFSVPLDGVGRLQVHHSDGRLCCQLRHISDPGNSCDPGASAHQTGF